MFRFAFLFSLFASDMFRFAFLFSLFASYLAFDFPSASLRLETSEKTAFFCFEETSIQKQMAHIQNVSRTKRLLDKTSPYKTSP
jgi:hypothetical protein